MVNKILVVLLGLLLVSVSPVLSVELVLDQGHKVPSVFAMVSGDNVSYSKTVTAYSSQTFNTLLNAHGVTLKPENVVGVPTSYAKLVDGEIEFNRVPIAYEPSAYHSIFVSYGLELLPENVDKLKGITYAYNLGNEIVFVNKPIAYSGDTLATILSAYTLPVVVAEVAPPPAPEVKAQITINTAYMFEFDSSEIKPHYFLLLDDVVSMLRENPFVRFEIQGHACDIGTEEYNQGLSERRAMAIFDYIVSKGIISSRFEVVGYGELNPAYPNDSEENRSRNRRVELVEIK